MLKSHARIILKPIQYWKLRYDEKPGKYFQEFTDSDESFLPGRYSGSGSVTDGS
jgi:hypothetical protein